MKIRQQQHVPTRKEAPSSTIQPPEKLRLRRSGENGLQCSASGPSRMMELGAWCFSGMWMLALGASFCCALPSFAADEPPAPPPKSTIEKFAEQDYLLGTWGGLRTKL